MHNRQHIWSRIAFGALLAFLIPQRLWCAPTVQLLDDAFGTWNATLGRAIFLDLLPGEAELPFIVAWLIFGSIFLTLRYGFINLRMLRHAFYVLIGRYRTRSDQGEVSSFQALSTALAATVGLGNIAGVAIAITMGGPGATFWMIVAGFLGMSTKFTEATLAQMYRTVRPDGRLMGGAMEYLSRGLAEKGWARTGRFLAGLFAVFTVLGALGAGSGFQVSQSLGAVRSAIPFFDRYPIGYGLLVALLGGAVIIGGLRRIAWTAEKLVPAMIVLYMLSSWFVILSHADMIGPTFQRIVTSAFTAEAAVGGVLGAIVQGFKRAAFSSEAGLGSAAIVHSTAAVKYPVRQGMVALYEPFIDTVIICTTTALVLLISGMYDDPALAVLRDNREGAALTAAAFAAAGPLFANVFTLSVFLFAFSTMLSWFYYGERCWVYLFGERRALIYKIAFLFFIVAASVTSAKNILEFTDLLVLAMSFPNVLGLYLLSGKVKNALNEYIAKLRAGIFDREAQR